MPVLLSHTGVLHWGPTSSHAFRVKQRSLRRNPLNTGGRGFWGGLLCGGGVVRRKSKKMRGAEEGRRAGLLSLIPPPPQTNCHLFHFRMMWYPSFVSAAKRRCRAKVIRCTDTFHEQGHVGAGNRHIFLATGPSFYWVQQELSDSSPILKLLSVQPTFLLVSCDLRHSRTHSVESYLTLRWIWHTCQPLRMPTCITLWQDLWNPYKIHYYPLLRHPSWSSLPFIVSRTKHISSWKFWIICEEEDTRSQWHIQKGNKKPNRSKESSCTLYQHNVHLDGFVEMAQRWYSTNLVRKKHNILKQVKCPWIGQVSAG